MRSEADVQRVLSQRAHTLLGRLVTLADSHGEVAVTRKKLAMALGVSTPTVSRALRELRESGAIVVIAEGGGRGQPTRYRITAVARDRVPENRGSGESRHRAPAVTAGARFQKQCQLDPVLEPDLDPEAVHSVALELGESLVAGTVGFLQGAWNVWKGLPLWGRMAMAGIPLGTAGALIGRAQGGQMGALIGGGAGVLVGTLLATLTPSESEAAPPQPPTPCPNQPPESTASGIDPISAIVRPAWQRR